MVPVRTVLPCQRPAHCITLLKALLAVLLVALRALEKSDEENFIAAKNDSEPGKYLAQLLSVYAVT